MQQPDPSAVPERTERPRRRGLFTRVTAESPAPPLERGDAEALVAATQRIVEQRLEQGLRAIQQTAHALMHEIAGEVWRSAGGDKDEVQAKILEGIARDQTIRSLIAHSDERFQALAVRTARLEDELAALSEQTRAAREALADGIDALAKAAAQTTVRDVETIRGQIDDIGRRVAAALEAIAARDQAMVETVEARVREHGALVAQETAHIAESMQAYVQEGVSALGRLAGVMQGQMEQAATRDADLTARLQEAVGNQVRLLGEQLQLLYERLAIDTTSLTEALSAQGERAEGGLRAIEESLQFLHDRIGVESREAKEAIHALESRTVERLATAHGLVTEALQASEERQRAASREVAVEVSKEVVRAVESRVIALARLVRSDSEALRGALVHGVAERDEAVARLLDERLERVSRALTEATRWTVEEMTRRLREETERAVRARLDEAVSAIDRNMVRMADTLETELDRLGQTFGRQAAEAADAAIGDRFDATVDRLSAATTAITLATEDAGRIRRTVQEDLARALDERVAALARMIRSDNRAIAERLQSIGEQDSAKQALRAVKELQANLPAEIAEIVDRRFEAIAQQIHRDVQATAESVARVSDMLDRKVEEVTARIGKRYDNDLQDVIDRMGDAMHALATLGRQRSSDRIELE
jgi:uncharacterized protein YaaW (UPF0174 family)